MPEVRSAASDRITLKGERDLGMVWLYADTSIPFRFTPPEEPLVRARERVAQADAQQFQYAARGFAQQARHVDGVNDVVLHDDGFIVYAIARDLDMQRDLRLHAMFLDAAPEGVAGELVVLVEGEDERPPGVSLS